MGEPKQLLRLGENCLLGKVLENVRATEVNEVVLVLGFAAEQIKRQVSTRDVKIVLNKAYGSGMGSSLREGVSALEPETSAVLIVLADQPFVRSETLDHLIAQYRQSEAQIAIPVYRGFRGNPVLLDRSVFPELMSLRGDIGCRAIFGNHWEGIVKVPVDDIGILLDIDSKDDLEKLQDFGRDEEKDRTLIDAANLEGRDAATMVQFAHKEQLIIVGTEPVAVILAKLGKMLHLTVAVVDPLLKNSDLPEADRVLNVLDLSLLQSSRDAYVVVASRGRFDEEAVEQALHTNSAYIGLIASKRRGQEIRLSLELRGVAPDRLAALRFPAGLDIGAETPEEIALSIMAEIVSQRRKTRTSKPDTRL